jgi:hypothetical protein
VDVPGAPALAIRGGVGPRIREAALKRRTGYLRQRATEHGAWYLARWYWFKVNGRFSWPSLDLKRTGTQGCLLPREKDSY